MNHPLDNIPEFISKDFKSLEISSIHEGTGYFRIYSIIEETSKELIINAGIIEGDIDFEEYKNCSRSYYSPIIHSGKLIPTKLSMKGKLTTLLLKEYKKNKDNWFYVDTNKGFYKWFLTHKDLEGFSRVVDQEIFMEDKFIKPFAVKKSWPLIRTTHHNKGSIRYYQKDKQFTRKVWVNKPRESKYDKEDVEEFSESDL